MTDDSTPTLTLYHGDNGVHEFYETAPDAPNVLIISHYKPDQWFVLECELDVRPRKVNRHAAPLSSVIRELAECLEVRVIIDPHHEYRGWRHDLREMNLCET